MILTLTKNVARLGRIGDRVRVSDAYARNVLVPQKMGFVGEQTVYSSSEKAKEAVDHNHIEAQLKDSFLFTRKANDKGGLYEKISHADIEKAIAERVHLRQTSVSCDLPESLSSVGQHQLSCNIDSKTYSLTIVIQPA